MTKDDWAKEFARITSLYRQIVIEPLDTMNYNATATTPADRIKQAEAELAAAVQAKQEQDERDALVARFDNDRHLAEATISLISRARSLRLKSSCEGSSDGLARFRKELSPLAESYGVRIVLTGDKSTATVVLA